MKGISYPDLVAVSLSKCALYALRREKKKKNIQYFLNIISEPILPSDMHSNSHLDAFAHASVTSYTFSLPSKAIT